MLVNQSTLAGLFRRTARTLRDWHADGLEDHRDPETGNYDLAGAIGWLLERERQRFGELMGARNGDAPSLEEARARKETALAQLRELDLAEREGGLLPVAAVDKVLDAAHESIDAILDSIPGTWPPRLAGLSAPEIQVALQDLADRLKGELWDFADELDEAPGPDPSDPLPDDFPEVAHLRDAGVERWTDLHSVPDLESLPGIGPARAERITQAMEARDGS